MDDDNGHIDTSGLSLNESHDSDEDIVADIEDDENDDEIEDEEVDEEDVEHTEPDARYLLLLFFRANNCCRRTACLWLRCDNSFKASSNMSSEQVLTQRTSFREDIVSH